LSRKKGSTKRLVLKKRDRSRISKGQSIPRTADQYFAKPEKFKNTWNSVITAIGKMRHEKMSLTRAAKEAGISRDTVLHWGRPAIQKRSNGKYVTKPHDNLLRVMMIPGERGSREIAIRGSRQASMLGEYWNAVHHYLATGDASQLKQFKGKSIKDADGIEMPLTTDTKELNRLGSAGVLSFESLYARSA